MPFTAPPGATDPGLLLGFVATACVWAMGMILEWSGRRKAARGTLESTAAVAALPWEDAAIDAPGRVEHARAA